MIELSDIQIKYKACKSSQICHGSNIFCKMIKWMNNSHDRYGRKGFRKILVKE